MLRRTRMQRRPLRRRAKDAVFDCYVRWLHDIDCVVCGGRQAIQGSHVGYGGVGLKNGDACDMVPMCGPHNNRVAHPDSVLGMVIGCHAEWEQHKGLFEMADRGTRAMLALRWRLETWKRFLRWCEAGGCDAGEEADCATAIRERLERLEVPCTTEA
jgi:hypothetical protein